MECVVDRKKDICIQLNFSFCLNDYNKQLNSKKNKLERFKNIQWFLISFYLLFFILFIGYLFSVVFLCVFCVYKMNKFIEILSRKNE